MQKIEVGIKQLEAVIARHQWTYLHVLCNLPLSDQLQNLIYL